MSPRKPPGVSWESFVEQQIRRAREESAFDDLPGAGEPLPNLEDAADPLWWAKSLVVRERVSVLPPALEIRRTAERVMAEIAVLGREEVVRERLEALDAEIRRLNARVGEGPPTNLAPLDVEAILRTWREARSRG